MIESGDRLSQLNFEFNDLKRTRKRPVLLEGDPCYLFMLDGVWVNYLDYVRKLLFPSVRIRVRSKLSVGNCYPNKVKHYS